MSCHTDKLHSVTLWEIIIIILHIILTLFIPGGRILLAATLDVNNFFNIKVNATKLGDFF